jgi:hypothetical protein
MPAKKTILTEEQRAKNIREAAEKIGASNDPKILDEALKGLKPSAPRSRPSGQQASS